MLALSEAVISNATKGRLNHPEQLLLLVASLESRLLVVCASSSIQHIRLWFHFSCVLPLMLDVLAQFLLTKFQPRSDSLNLPPVHGMNGIPSIAVAEVTLVTVRHEKRRIVKRRSRVFFDACAVSLSLSCHFKSNS
jgi:hypothetical protein